MYIFFSHTVWVWCVCVYSDNVHNPLCEESEEEGAQQVLINTIHNWSRLWRKLKRSWSKDESKLQIKYQLGTVEVLISPPQGNVFLVNKSLSFKSITNISNVLLSFSNVKENRQLYINITIPSWIPSSDL